MQRRAYADSADTLNIETAPTAMYEVSARARFSAAHHLERYDGSCADVHGHNWEVEVSVSGAELDDRGILVDFRELRRLLAQVLSEFDHKDLNRLDVFKEQSPTSEYLARLIFERLSAMLNTGSRRVSKVTVQETPDTRAVYSE